MQPRGAFNCVREGSVCKDWLGLADFMQRARCVGLRLVSKWAIPARVSSNVAGRALNRRALVTSASCQGSNHNRSANYTPSNPTRLASSSADAKDGDEQKNETNSISAETTTSVDRRPSDSDGEPAPTDGNPGAIGGFMRGLMGGRDVAAEDAFVAEAKERGIDLPPPPPLRRADLVPVKRRKRRDESEDNDSESIRDRLFSRFAGSPFMQGAFDAKDRIAERIDESDNPIINFFRNIYDRVFAENEMGMVVREIREEDKSFTVSEFLGEVEDVLIPDILGAYLAGGRDKLEEICTEDAYRMLSASIRERETEGIVMDTNVLDISDVELTAGRLLEDAPVLIVTFSAQQINCLRDKSGAVIEGAVDDIRAVYYVFAFVREVELEEAAPSGGGMGASEAENSGSENGSDRDPGAKKSDGSSSSGTGEVEDEDDDEGKTDDSKPSALPRWKLLEMVIRGAHATI